MSCSITCGALGAVANSAEGIFPLRSDSLQLTNGQLGLRPQVQGLEQVPPDGWQSSPLAPADTATQN